MQRPYYFLIIAFLIGTPSCFRNGESRQPRHRESEAFESDDQTDSIDRAMPFVPMLMRFERGSILKDFNNQLNSWALKQTAPTSWKRSSLLASFPESLLSTDFGARLDRMEFADLESEYLAQCKLMKDVGQWIVERPYRDSLFAPWMIQQFDKLPQSDAIRLEQTLKIFDWTIRNISLEGTPKDIEALVRDPILPLSDIGAGYRMLPWQTMMIGRGDAIQRSRVFTQLLFQLDIPAVVLALPDKATTSTENDRLLWCVGVPIGGEIYLFETRFGIPLPVADQAAVATLREAKTNASILRRAKLPGRFEYPVSIGDLSKAIALIDVEPFAIGVSAKALEERLTGEYRMKLSIDTDRVIESLRAIDPELKVQLWQLPWLAQLYNRKIRSQINDLSAFSINYMAEFGAYFNESIVQEARMAHFRGEFNSTIDMDGAPKKYMNIRIDEGTLAKLEYDTDVQRQLQIIRRGNEKFEEFHYRIQMSQQFYRTAKLDSNAFLGMLQFDLNNLDAAEDWLDHRLLKIQGTERWRAHARYLLGRCFEERGKTAEAIEWYKNEGSPQEAGNRIRVRLLEKKAKLNADQPER